MRKFVLVCVMFPILVLAVGCGGSKISYMEPVAVRFPNDHPDSDPDYVSAVVLTEGSWVGGKTTYIQPVHSRLNKHIYPDPAYASTGPAVTLNLGASANLVLGRITGLNRTVNTTTNVVSTAEGGAGGEGGDGGVHNITQEQRQEQMQRAEAEAAARAAAEARNKP